MTRREHEIRHVFVTEDRTIAIMPCKNLEKETA